MHSRAASWSGRSARAASTTDAPAAAKACAAARPMPLDAPVITTTASLLLRIMVRRRSEEHTSELQSLMRISYAVFCLKKKNINSYTDASYRHQEQTTRSHAH